MEAKDVGRILGSFAIGMLPPISGLYVYGKMKDEKKSTGASAIVGGLTMSFALVTMSLVNHYLLGWEPTAAQISSLVDSGAMSSTAGLGRMGAPPPPRVFAPFGSDFRQVGSLRPRVGCRACGA